MSYYITNDDSYRYTYDYIEDYDEQKQLTDIVKDYFMPRLGKANPYSVLLVKKIYKWETNNGVYVLDTWNGAHPTMINGVRCLALAMGEREDMGEEEFYNYIFNTYVANYIDKLYDNDYSSFDPFYNYCDNIYGYSKKELGYEREYNDSLAMSLGLLSDWNNNYFPSKSNDLKLYKTAICETPMSEVENMREEFPIVYEKFKFLRDLVLASGIILKD